MLALNILVTSVLVLQHLPPKQRREASGRMNQRTVKDYRKKSELFLKVVLTVSEIGSPTPRS